MRLVPFLVLSIALFPNSLHAAANPQNGQVRVKQSSEKQTTQTFHLSNPQGLFKPSAGYSQIAEVNDGKLVFISGQVAVDKTGALVGKDDFRAQVQQVFENLKAAVGAAGGDFHNVIKLNFYCVDSVDAAQMPAVREIRDKYVDTSNPPRQVPSCLFAVWFGPSGYLK